MRPVRREVERLLEAGSLCGGPKTDGTCRDILKRREALWTFVQGDGGEPTNNAAERSLRPGVRWRQGSFGTQSEAGARFVESMMTVMTTLRQQKRSVLAYLIAACAAALRGEAAPSLLPASDQQSQAVAWCLFSLPERLRHQLRGLDLPRKRECFTAIHNFFLTRPDGTTAAERFFGQKPRSMFATILESVELPPAPLSPPRRA
jgi:hypothetical protein